MAVVMQRPNSLRYIITAPLLITKLSFVFSPPAVFPPTFCRSRLRNSHPKQFFSFSCELEKTQKCGLRLIQLPAAVSAAPAVPSSSQTLRPYVSPFFLQTPFFPLVSFSNHTRIFTKKTRVAQQGLLYWSLIKWDVTPNLN